MDFDFIEIAKNAKNASLKVAELDTNIKNQALKNIAQMLEEHKSEIFEANALDLKEAQNLVEIGEIHKSTLHAPSCSRLIDAIYNLLEVLFNLLTDGHLAANLRSRDDFVCAQIVIVSPLFSCIVVEANEELW